MTQIKTKTVSLESIFFSPEFARGVYDYSHGLPLDTDEHRANFSYERGRHFAALTGLRKVPSRTHPKIPELLRAYKIACRKGYII